MNGARLSEVGRVSALGEGTAEIRLARGAACARCGACRSGEGADMILVVRRTQDLSVGRAVRVTFPYGSLWGPIFHVFVLPLALFFAFAAAAGLLLGAAGVGGALGGVLVFVCAMAGAAVGLAAGRYAQRRFRRRVFEQTTVELLDEA